MIKKAALHLALAVSVLGLTGCSTNFFSSQQTASGQRYANNSSASVGGSAENPVATGVAPGGSIANKMDEADKSKMFHALDSAPGKATNWTNPNTGISYTVTPTKKVTLNGNPYCREYETTAVKGERQNQLNGTACVGQDGQWHSV